MQTYFFELITSCRSCGNPLFLNAFVNSINCEHCHQKNDIPSKLWKVLVVGPMTEAFKFQEGQKYSRKVFSGGFEVSTTFGKRKSRCSKCQTMIPDTVYDTFDSGDYICTKCGNAISIRKPDSYVMQFVNSAMYIVAEDSAQIKTGINGMEKPEALKPVIFTCPACAANLEVDGTKRTIKCNYCDASVYLPDDLWFELHPARTVDRWYIIKKEEEYVPEQKPKADTPPEWHNLSDVAIDMKGNLYLAGADSENNNFFVWSLSPDLKLRWIRRNIKIDSEYTGLSVSNNKKLLLWNKFKHSLIILSANDGSDYRTIQGEDVSNKTPYPFTLKGCDALLSDSDNTILAVINNTFVRYYDDGMRAPLWKVVSNKNDVPGLFSRLFGGGNNAVKIPADSDWSPSVKEIGNIPKRVSGEYIRINLGFDGFVYILDKNSPDPKIAKYTREGKQEWKRPNPLASVECKPCIDSNGNIFLVGLDANKKTKLIKISSDGNKITTLQTDVLDGGILSGDELLELSPDGKIYTFSYGNFMKAFNSDLTCEYESEQSKAQAQERIKIEKERNQEAE